MMTHYLRKMRGRPVILYGSQWLAQCWLGIFWRSEATNTVRAQLSCDNPPLDVSRISSVWDKTDFCQYEEGVFDEIISGGVPRDGIPPIDNPQFESIDAPQWLQPQSPVIAFQLDGIARLSLILQHEIVATSW
jgi:hypothetical protein